MQKWTSMTLQRIIEQQNLGSVKCVMRQWDWINSMQFIFYCSAQFAVQWQVAHPSHLVNYGLEYFIYLFIYFAGVFTLVSIPPKLCILCIALTQNAFNHHLFQNSWIPLCQCSSSKILYNYSIEICMYTGKI